MKHILLSLTAAGVLCLMTPLSAAERHTISKAGVEAAGEELFSARYVNGEQVAPEGLVAVRRNTPELENEEEFVVTVTLDLDKSLYRPDWDAYAMKEGYGSIYKRGEWDGEYPGTYSFFLPEGKYNLFFIFDKLDEDRNCQAIVYKENVVVSDDIELMVNPAEATTVLEFAPLDPDGNILSDDIFIWDGDDILGLWQKGMLEYTKQSFDIISKSCGGILSESIMRYAYWYEDDALHSNSINKIYTTQTDDLIFASVTGGVGLEESIACMLVADGSTSRKVSNTTDYTVIPQQFVASPYQREPDEDGQVYTKGHYCVSQYQTGYNNEMRSTECIGVVGDRFEQKRILAWQPAQAERYGMTILPVPTSYESLADPQLGMDMNNGLISALPVNFDNGEANYVGWINNYFGFTVNDQGIWDFHLADNPFMVMSADSDPLWGYGFPVIPTYFDRDGDVCWNVAGARGENRRIDRALLKKIFNGYEENRNYFTPDFINGSSMVLEDTNFTLGGIQGRNTTEITFAPSEEKLPNPTLQMLRTTDTEGNVCNEFLNASEAMVQLYCGVFSLMPTEDGYRYFAEVPAEGITLEYSPYQKDAWENVDVIADPSRDFLPGWGNFYQASLSNVNRPSDNNWYDLRIALDNGNGGVTIETISPAFRIGEDSSVTSVYSDATIRVRGNSIEAPAEAKVFTIDGTETGRNNLPAGIYLVRLGDHTRKLIIR